MTSTSPRSTPFDRRAGRSRSQACARHPFVVKALVTAVCVACLGGCAVSPEPMLPSDLAAQAKSDRAAARRDVAPLNGPLGLNEAIARALKYNLQQRSFLMEQALAVGQLDLARYDMLPKLTAQAGYFSRDKDAISRSTDSVTGLPSLANPYISSDRNYSTFDLTLSWNVLDFGLSYHNAKQGADRVLIAGERRRKAMHVLMQDVRTAFWRAASAQKLQGELKQTIAMAESALADSRQVEASKLRNPVESLRYQRTLLETLRVLETIEQELAASRFELAQLVNLDPGTAFTLVEPDGAELNPPALNLDPQRMEELAIGNNAELREQFYNVRLATTETRKTLLRMFPNLNFAAGPKYSDNSYLINSQWNEVAAQVSWNLLSVLSLSQAKKLAEGNVGLAEQRRVATQMAVLTQAYLARDLYQGAWQQLQRADAIWRIDQQIHRHGVNREAAEMQARLELVSSNTAAIVSMLRRYQALSQVHAAASKLQATLGLEPQVGSVDSTALEDLVRQVEQTSGQWRTADVAGSSATATATATAPAAAAAEAPGAAPAAQPAAPVAASAPAPVTASEVAPAAAPADARRDVRSAVDAWAAAWSRKDLAAYFAAYSPKFSGGKSRPSWEADRRARITGKPSISVELSDVDTQVQGDRAVVQFQQRYTAGALKESSRKRLEMARVAGRWLIEKESVVAAAKAEPAAKGKAGRK